MYQKYHKEFTKALESVDSGSRALSATFRDFCHLTRMCFQQVQQFDREREDEIIKIQRASKNPNGYAEGLAVLVNALDYRVGDFLVEWAGLNTSLNRQTGQVFTPYHISKMMAEIIMGEPKKQERPFSICEPTCGAGSMVIAAFDVLKNKNFSPKDFYIVAQDIDIHCVNMTYIQCTLLDIPAIVYHGDSLAYKFYARYPTMTFVRNHLIKVE